MTSYLGLFLTYLLLYKYAALGVIVFVAGMILPLPINTLLLAVGAFSAEGFFSFPVSFLVATASNILADVADYTVFKRYGHAILRDRYATKYSYFVRLEEYVQSHTGLTIIISRIVGILGPSVNFLAGYLKISFQKFLLFDIVGNAIYVLFFLGAGFFVGNEWSTISGFLSIISAILFVLVLLVLLIVLYRKNTMSSKS